MKGISKNSWRSLLIETAVFGTITFMAPVMLVNRASADDAQQGKTTGSVSQTKAGNATSLNNAVTGTAASTTATQLDNNQSNSGTTTAAVSSESVTTGGSVAVSALTTKKIRLMICRMRPHKQCSQVSKQAHQRLLRKLRNRAHLRHSHRLVSKVVVSEIRHQLALLLVVPGERFLGPLTKRAVLSPWVLEL